MRLFRPRPEGATRVRIIVRTLGLAATLLGFAVCKSMSSKDEPEAEIETEAGMEVSGVDIDPTPPATPGRPKRLVARIP